MSQVRRAAAASGQTVSAWIAEAAADRVGLQGLDQLVADWQANNGAFSEEELARADAILDEAGVVDHRTQPTASERAS